MTTLSDQATPPGEFSLRECFINRDNPQSGENPGDIRLPIETAEGAVIGYTEENKEDGTCFSVIGTNKSQIVKLYNEGKMLFNLRDRLHKLNYILLFNEDAVERGLLKPKHLGGGDNTPEDDGGGDTPPADAPEAVKCWIDFSRGCNVCYDQIIAYPVVLENGKQVGTFRYYKQTGKWGTCLSRPEPGIYQGRGVPSKQSALRLLERRLARQGRTLIENPEGDGGRECPPAEAPAMPCFIDWDNPTIGTEVKNWTEYPVKVVDTAHGRPTGTLRSGLVVRNNKIAFILNCVNRWAFYLRIDDKTPIEGAEEYPSYPELEEALKSDLSARGYTLLEAPPEGGGDKGVERREEADNKADTMPQSAPPAQADDPIAFYIDWNNPITTFYGKEYPVRWQANDEIICRGAWYSDNTGAWCVFKPGGLRYGNVHSTKKEFIAGVVAYMTTEFPQSTLTEGPRKADKPRFPEADNKADTSPDNLPECYVDWDSPQEDPDETEWTIYHISVAKIEYGRNYGSWTSPLLGYLFAEDPDNINARWQINITGAKNIEPWSKYYNSKESAVEGLKTMLQAEGYHLTAA